MMSKTVMFPIESIADLPTPVQLWKAVCTIQSRAKTRLLEEKDIKSGAFLDLCEAALVLCEKYGLDKNLIEVIEEAGSIPNRYGHLAKTSTVSFDGEIIRCDRINPRFVSHGNSGVRYCQMRVLVKNPAREALARDGWIAKGDGYARITEESFIRLCPKPQPTDVVLGGVVARPKPTDAVLGGCDRRHTVLGDRSTSRRSPQLQG